MRPDELQPCDVLLFHGRALYRRLIQLLDGSEYSHAGLYDGENSVEALGDGVTTRPLWRGLAVSPYVDVYRWVGPAGRRLGEAGYPAQPVLERLDAFLRTANRYAYEDILLLAALSAARKAHLRGAGLDVAGLLDVKLNADNLPELLRDVEDRAAALAAELAQTGRQPLTCSEMVYRCFAEAGDGRYKLTIPASRDPDAKFVTPSDLAASPTLRKVGRLGGGSESLLAMPNLGGE